MLPGVVDRIPGTAKVPDMSPPQALVESSCRLVVSNRGLLAASQARIAWSRRLLNPWHGVSGGSLDDNLATAAASLYHHVRTRLQERALPPAPKLVLAGRATVRRTCIVCRRTIRAGSFQHESVAADGQQEWSHTLCLRVWVDATVGLEARPTK